MFLSLLQVKSKVDALILFDLHLPGRAFTLGPIGADVSTNRDRIWRGLKPGPSEGPNADRNWNVLLPVIITGPKGRIGEPRLHVVKR
jgi:hypothetical protein